MNHPLIYSDELISEGDQLKINAYIVFTKTFKISKKQR